MRTDPTGRAGRTGPGQRAEITRLTGVYLLTPDATASEFDRVLRIVDAALVAGVDVVQYRNKGADRSERERQATALVRLVDDAGALAIVNDDAELAAATGAHGVHLGRDDGDAFDVRKRWPGLLLGVSCYDDLARAQAAVAAGADAIAFGSMFASSTKPAAVRAPLALLSAARSRWPSQRVIAIGGIAHTNIADVAAAGAHAAAVISAIFDAADPARAAGELVDRFHEGQQRHESQRAVV